LLPEAEEQEVFDGEEKGAFDDMLWVEVHLPQGHPDV